MASVPGNLGVDSGDKRSESLAAGLGCLSLLHLLPVPPVLEPCLVILAKVKVDIEAPAHGFDPFKLKSIKLADGNAADFRPGAILEGVVVEELAAEKQRDGKISPDLTLRGLVRSHTLQSVDPLGEIVHSQENGSAGKSRGSENLRDKLAEGRSDRRLGGDDANRHLSNVFSHHVDLVIEDGTYATGHDEGCWRDSDEDRLDLVGRRGNSEREEKGRSGPFTMSE